MILVLGGTTEGRKAVATLDKAGKPFYYSTVSDLQEIDSLNAIRITGGFNAEGMKAFCTSHDIRLLIDAAHPFASNLHSAVAECADSLKIPVLRYERRYPERDPRIIICEDFKDASDKMNSDGVRRLLALTGVKTITKLHDFCNEHDCYFRILNREDSISQAKERGVTPDKLLFYEEETEIKDIFHRIRPDAIITKESGDSGGYLSKVEAAFEEGIKVYVVKRPLMPNGFKIVTGEYGLRKGVEHYLPDFYDLRSGFTTGACATAAAKAALLAIVADDEPEYVSFAIPDGEEMRLKVNSLNIIDAKTAIATIVKDAGDDPDITHGCRISAKVSLSDHGDVHFFGGEGIGTVTLPGTGLEIGEPAINPVPRKMIRQELLGLYPAGCDVTISAEGGEELAKKTFNPRIGILGGISIIGTSGIVMPFSNEAFLESIQKEMEVAKAVGCERIVLNSGARSEKAVKSHYPNLNPSAFIHYGNAIGECLEMAESLDIKALTVGVMIGKAVKLAEGHSDTHSHKVTINREFIADLAEGTGCSSESVDKIKTINMAKELWNILSGKDKIKFFPCLLRKCKVVCSKYYSNGKLTMMLIADDGRIAFVD